MARWASRLTLIVEDVRVEPLQAIRFADAMAEGLERIQPAMTPGATWRDYSGRTAGAISPRASFATLWQSLHDQPGDRWEYSTIVVTLTFRVEHENIDRDCRVIGLFAQASVWNVRVSDLNLKPSLWSGCSMDLSQRGLTQFERHALRYEVQVQVSKSFPSSLFQNRSSDFNTPGYAVAIEREVPCDFQLTAIRQRYHDLPSRAKWRVL